MDQNDTQSPPPASKCPAFSTLPQPPKAQLLPPKLPPWYHPGLVTWPEGVSGGKELGENGPGRRAQPSGTGDLALLSSRLRLGVKKWGQVTLTGQ